MTKTSDVLELAVDHRSVAETCAASQITFHQRRQFGQRAPYVERVPVDQRHIRAAGRQRLDAPVDGARRNASGSSAWVWPPHQRPESSRSRTSHRSGDGRCIETNTAPPAGRGCVSTDRREHAQERPSSRKRLPEWRAQQRRQYRIRRRCVEAGIPVRNLLPQQPVRSDHLRLATAEAVERVVIDHQQVITGRHRSGQTSRRMIAAPCGRGCAAFLAPDQRRRWAPDSSPRAASSSDPTARSDHEPRRVFLRLGRSAASRAVQTCRHAVALFMRITSSLSRDGNRIFASSNVTVQLSRARNCGSRWRSEPGDGLHQRIGLEQRQ